MTIDSEILQTLVTMPEPLKQELLHYAKYLMENYSKDTISEQPPQNKRRSGILKGTFILPLPDDFDEPQKECYEVPPLRESADMGQKDLQPS